MILVGGVRRLVVQEDGRSRHLTLDLGRIRLQEVWLLPGEGGGVLVPSGTCQESGEVRVELATRHPGAEEKVRTVGEDPGYAPMWCRFLVCFMRSGHCFVL